MKKMLVLLCCFVMFFGSASAEIDLSTLTFDELVELQIKINKEITSRPEWKEAKIPSGIYKIGVDIPAGKWTITAKSSIVTYVYGSKLDEDEAYIDDDFILISSNLTSESNTLFDWGSTVNLDLKEGYYLWLDGETIFAKYTVSLF